MINLFYTLSVISILSTVFVIIQKNPVYSLLYLIISFISISSIYFLIGEGVIGSLEAIIYAGAIMVLFIFVMMILNLKNNNFFYEKKNISIRYLILCFVLAMSLFFIITYSFSHIFNHHINFYNENIKNLGKMLFNKYVLLIELSSMILLSALVIVFHFCTHNKK
ncbi:NADH-quinone oxidoreductase subunit J [Buchnera aphidicola]|uniref:NADH-quinone oxidoreductase subunit J n=1 Tax=Buchnera aphidicola TaxID=9 RepID=UPI00346393FE